MFQCKTHWASALVLCSLVVGCGSDEEETDTGGTPDKPDVVEITLDDSVSISEPQIGKISYAEVSVKLKSALSYNLTVSARTSDVSATSSGDLKNYTSLVGDFVIPAGIKELSIPISILRNELFEGDKKLNLFISLPSSSDYKLKNDKSVITIKDSDNEPEVNMVQPEMIIVEGDTTYLTLELSNYSNKDIKSQIAISGLATLVDYTTDMTGSFLTIPAKSKSERIKLDILQDQLPEGGESLVFDITSVSNASLGSDASAVILIPGSYGLDDTGVSTYFDGVNFDAASPQGQYPNQDASYGVDTLNPDDEKVNGDQGFFFTKIDPNGNTLTYNAPNWSCVKDERTGLYIEAKQEVMPHINQSDDAVKDTIDQYIKDLKDSPGTPYPYDGYHNTWRSSSYVYTWYNSNSKESGGNKGAENDKLHSKGYPVSSSCAYRQDESYAIQCNTEAYLEHMNAFAVCGFDDWVLPTVSQARSIINYNAIVELGATEFFPYLKAVGAAQSFVTRATAVNNNASGWCVSTPTGQVEMCHKGSEVGIIAVRGGVN